MQLLVCNDSIDFQYWNKITEQQSRCLVTFVFGDKTYYQINATVIRNISQNVFVNGELDNDRMDYHVLGVGGAAIPISFSG